MLLVLYLFCDVEMFRSDVWEKYIIHSKKWGNWGLNPADDLEFSAEKLSENATSIKITLFPELLTVISPVYVQSLQ